MTGENDCIEVVEPPPTTMVETISDGTYHEPLNRQFDHSKRPVRSTMVDNSVEDTLIRRSNICMKTDTVMGRRGFNSPIFSECIEEWTSRYENAKPSLRRQVAIDCINDMQEKGCRFLAPSFGHDDQTTTSESSTVYIQETDSEKVVAKVVRTLRRNIVQRNRSDLGNKRKEDPYYHHQDTKEPNNLFVQSGSTPSAKEHDINIPEFKRKHSLHFPGDDDEVNDHIGENLNCSETWNPLLFWEDITESHPIAEPDLKEQESSLTALLQSPFQAKNTLSNKINYRNSMPIEPLMILQSQTNNLQSSNKSRNELLPDGCVQMEAGLIGIFDVNVVHRRCSDSITSDSSARSKNPSDEKDIGQKHNLLESTTPQYYSKQIFNLRRNDADCQLVDEEFNDRYDESVLNQTYIRNTECSTSSQTNSQEKQYETQPAKLPALSPFIKCQRGEKRQRTNSRQDASNRTKKKSNVTCKDNQLDPMVTHGSTQATKSLHSVNATNVANRQQFPNLIRSRATYQQIEVTHNSSACHTLTREEKMNNYRRWMREGYAQSGEVPATRHLYSLDELSNRFEQAERRLEELSNHNAVLLDQITKLETKLRNRDESSGSSLIMTVSKPIIARVAKRKAKSTGQETKTKAKAKAKAKVKTKTKTSKRTSVSTRQTSKNFASTQVQVGKVVSRLKTGNAATKNKVETEQTGSQIGWNQTSVAQNSVRQISIGDEDINDSTIIEMSKGMEPYSLIGNDRASPRGVQLWEV